MATHTLRRWAPVLALAALVAAITLGGMALVVFFQAPVVPARPVAAAPPPLAVVAATRPSSPALAANAAANAAVAPTPARTRPVVAVMSGAQGTADFAAALNNSLATWPGLVAPALQRDPLQAAHDIGAPYVLVADATGAPDTVALHLLDALSGSSLWTGTTGAGTDADTAARAVVQALAPILARTELGRARTIPPNSTVAFDTAVAQRDFDRTDVQVVRALAALSGSLGQYADTQRLYVLARELDPFSTATNSADAASVLFAQRRYAEAAPLVEGCLHVDPRSQRCLEILAASQALLGQLAAARATAVDLLAASPGYTVARFTAETPQRADPEWVARMASALHAAGVPN